MACFSEIIEGIEGIGDAFGGDGVIASKGKGGGEQARDVGCRSQCRGVGARLIIVGVRHGMIVIGDEVTFWRGGLVFQPFSTSSAGGGRMSVPFELVAVIGTIAEILSVLVPILGITHFVLFSVSGGGHGKVLSERRQFLAARRVIGVRLWRTTGRSSCRGLFFRLLALVDSSSYHSNNILLNGVGGSGKAFEFIGDLVVFDNGLIHERLADKNGAFFEFVNLVASPLGPLLRLANLAVNSQSMEYLLGFVERASWGASENK